MIDLGNLHDNQRGDYRYVQSLEYGCVCGWNGMIKYPGGIVPIIVPCPGCGKRASRQQGFTPKHEPLPLSAGDYYFVGTEVFGPVPA